ncbi:hypothetical protein B0T18DRAFT_426806 [Schizothecium vesticola]|uniref:Uncharacterized protein n=1 Tax=Schizothecium vesticola TaxID=314040 RepID=A0AA40F6Z1_9PEZI|nr:hypothetical protein B0T18DRAFT_426806 [Schizothecium vesticola]
MDAFKGSLALPSHSISHGGVLKRGGDAIKQKSSPRTTVDFSTSDEWATFLYPSVAPPRQQWWIGETINIQLETGFASFVVELWQQILDNMGARGRSLGPTDVEGVMKTRTIPWMNWYRRCGEYLFKSFLSIGFSIDDGTVPILPGAGAVTNVSTGTSPCTSTSTSTGTSTAHTSVSTNTSAPTGQAAAGPKDSGNTNVTAIALGAVLGAVGLATLPGLFF